jgi:hypothetical protein
MGVNMTKEEAHAILDKIRDGMSVAGATEALERTGDICRPFSPTLRFTGDESSNDRPRQTHDKTTEVGFSYSKYLDCPTIESAT